jgi:hypothetical protein
MSSKFGLALVTGALIATTAPAAQAFCGFYVNSGGSEMFNDATQVVLMRSGTRTVLSMQNNYKGPPEAFALVIPVPTVLQKEDVKTLSKAVFEHVDQMGAPRLVEYWEEDPCYQPKYERYDMAPGVATGAAMARPEPASAPKDLGVTIEAKFEVGEYQVLILSAKDSTGLDTWLRQEKYQIPPGAEPFLRPYVESGMKFFVAKVDPTKVTFKDGRAELSPLRFHYDSDEFNLPIRLGLANSSGTQDLIVSVLAPGQRYEVANYKNVTIPTNLDVKDAVRDKFGEFYAALFDRTIEKNPGAVVTEYSWHGEQLRPVPGAGDRDGASCRRSGSTCWAATRGRPGAVRGRRDEHGLDAAARAVRQDRDRGPGVQGGGADRRRARVPAGQRQARGAVAAGLDQQLPGAVRDPPRVDRADHLQGSGARTLGRAAERRDRRRREAGPGPGLRQAWAGQAARAGAPGHPGARGDGGEGRGLCDGHTTGDRVGPRDEEERVWLPDR